MTNLAYYTPDAANRINADLYVWNGSAYVFYKKTLDGNPNPRSLNGQPSIISFYVSGAKPDNPINACAPKLLLNNGDATSQLLSGFAASGYVGVQLHKKQANLWGYCAKPRDAGKRD